MFSQTDCFCLVGRCYVLLLDEGQRVVDDSDDIGYFMPFVRSAPVVGRYLVSTDSIRSDRNL